MLRSSASLAGLGGRVRAAWRAASQALRSRLSRPASSVRVGLVMLVLAYLAIVLRNGWVVEEAYISFRVVDNLIHGYGLRFNTYERVCVLTNPLWTLVMAAAASVTHEVFFTSICLAVVLSAFTAWTLATRSSRMGGVVAILALCLSKSYVDWSTSGMENALGHLIFILIFVAFLRPAGPRAPVDTVGKLGVFTGLVALLAVNRLDAGVLVAVPWLVVVARFLRERRAPLRKVVLAVSLGALPLLAWELFSLLYYGFPFPNTYYAKLTMGVPPQHLAIQGARYLHYSLLADPLTVLVMAAGVVLAVAGPKRKDLWPLGVGIGLFVIYVVRVGGDFMAGRFWTLPFLAAVAVLAQHPLRASRSEPQVAAGALALLAWAAGLPTLNKSYEALRPGLTEVQVGDYRRGSLQASSLEWAMDHDVPEHEYVGIGREAAKKPEVVRVWGAMGYAPYFAGPRVKVIDKFAVGDGLLSHLPMPHPERHNWRIGHFERAIPAGYVESVEAGENRIQDPDLARFYDDLILVQRAPLLSRARLAAMARVLGGAHREELGRYVDRMNRAP
jgi:arabinofuranosyltransferase